MTVVEDHAELTWGGGKSKGAYAITLRVICYRNWVLVARAARADLYGCRRGPICPVDR
jgi:hypothetical protein